MHKLKLLCIYMIQCLYFCIILNKTDHLDIDFDQAMSDNNIPYNLDHANINPEWILSRNAYKIWQKAALTQQNIRTSKIPPVFHLIWLGSPIPQRFLQLKEQLLQLHPNCTVKVWTDLEAKTYSMINRNAFEQASNFGEKSDIWRYEILYNEGGIYIDGDFQLIQPFNIFLETCDLFTGMSQSTEFSLCNGLIGTIAAHPIMKLCIDGISSDNNPQSEAIMQRSGPYHFTRCFISGCNNNPGMINVALPPSFFYPWPHYVSFEHDPIKQAGYIKPYSYAIHQWACSWQWWSPYYRK